MSYDNWKSTEPDPQDRDSLEPAQADEAGDWHDQRQQQGIERQRELEDWDEQDTRHYFDAQHWQTFDDM